MDKVGSPCAKHRGRDKVKGKRGPWRPSRRSRSPFNDNVCGLDAYNSPAAGALAQLGSCGWALTLCRLCALRP